MARFFHYVFPEWWRKSCRWLLALSWLLGLVLGSSVYLYSDGTLFSLMRGAAGSSVSIVSLLVSLYLPFLISAFAVSIRKPWLLLVVSFGKAFAFSFVSLVAMAAFGSAGWLVRVLLQFSELCTIPMLCLFWLRCISGENRLSSEFFLLSGLILLAGSIDFCYISPIMARLIEF